jgi:hypothetical protein
MAAIITTATIAMSSMLGIPGMMVEPNKRFVAGGPTVTRDAIDGEPVIAGKLILEIAYVPAIGAVTFATSAALIV